jgi:hypothetical protein
LKGFGFWRAEAEAATAAKAHLTLGFEDIKVV